MGDSRAIDGCYEEMMMEEETEENNRLVKLEEDCEVKTKGESGVLRWEDCLPKTGIRVLLVEADDSTRQIIAALLKKCNYKVAAIGDGLKAWDILKRSHNNIDLVLTEVDLPSISGYALLTLMMEHDGCKKIPVIMTSSCDSIRTAFRCVAKGAADYLLKPVRKNELKNLWQHVWRRDLLTYDHDLLKNPTSPCRIEATSRMKEASDDQSNDNLSSCPQNNQSAAVANDAQGFSWSHVKEAELCSSGHNNSDRQEVGVQREDDASTRPESLEAVVGSCTDGKMNQYKRGRCEEAIDLIANIDSHQTECTSSHHQLGSNSESNGGSISDLELELTLTRSEVKDLPHRSIASALSWFDSNKRLKTSYSSSDSISSTKINGDSRGFNSQLTSSEDGYTFPFFFGNNSTEGSEEPPQVVNPSSFQGGLGFGSIFSQLQKKQRDLTPEPVHLRESSSFLTSSSLKSDPGSMMGHSDLNESRNNQYKTIAVPEASDKLQKHAIECNPGSRDVLGSASADGLTNKSTTTSVEDEQVNDNSTTCNDASAHDDDADDDKLSKRKAYREAALAKFRQKRKDRCFEKKVRYQSRKRLAEMRPRVKGQFVCKG